MSDDELLSLEEVAERCNIEGTDYAVQHYLSADQIADPELRAYWRTAKIMLDRIDEILEPWAE